MLADEFDNVRDSAYHRAFLALAYGFLSTHGSKKPERQTELAAKAIDQARQFIQLGEDDFKMLRGETDYDFAALQSVPGYLQMLAEEEAKLAKPGSTWTP